MNQPQITLITVYNAPVLTMLKGWFSLDFRFTLVVTKNRVSFWFTILLALLAR